MTWFSTWEKQSKFRSFIYNYCVKAINWRSFIKYDFLQILQNLQENTCARFSFLIIKKENRCFSTMFCPKHLRTPILFYCRLSNGCFWKRKQFYKFSLVQKSWFFGHSKYLYQKMRSC